MRSWEKYLENRALHFLAKNNINFSGPLLGPLLDPYWTYFDHIGFILFSLWPGPGPAPWPLPFTFGPGPAPWPLPFSLGPGPAPWPPSPKLRGIAAGFLFPWEMGVLFLLEMCFMCFLEKVSLGPDFSPISLPFPGGPVPGPRLCS